MPAKKRKSTKKVEGGAEAPAKPKVPKAPKDPKKKPKELDSLKEINARWVADSNEKRQRLATRRFSLGKKPVAAVPVARKVKGKGMKLKNIPRVSSHIKCTPLKSKALTTLHRLVIGKVAKGVEVKKNLLSFNGLVYDEDFLKEKLEAKIENLDLRVLRQVCELVALDADGDRETLTEELIKFLEKPKELDHSPRKSASVSRVATKKRKTSKDEVKVKRPLSGYMFFCKDKREGVLKKDPKLGVTDVAKKLGAQWGKLSSADKKPYEKQAAKDKERYAKELAKHGLSPTKKSSPTKKGSPKKSPKKSSPKKTSPKKKKQQESSSESSDSE